MASSNSSAVTELLNQKPFRILPNHKQLTIALGGIYIASTTAAAKPSLVWETEQSYPRYYIPVESILEEIQAQFNGPQSHTTTGSTQLTQVETVSGNDSSFKAIIERLTVGAKTTTWVRFLDGPLKNFVRFERSEMGEFISTNP
jgi:hypothetical protein